MVGGVIQCSYTNTASHKNSFECNVCKRNPSKKKETQNPEEVKREYGSRGEDAVFAGRLKQGSLSAALATRIGSSLHEKHFDKKGGKPLASEGEQHWAARDNTTTHDSNTGVSNLTHELYSY